MIVVADTSPINYLVLIGHIDLLDALYERVLIPSEVHSELLHSQAPTPVRLWAENLPEWCEVRAVSWSVDPSLNQLDAGERDAIMLALNAGVDTILMDDAAGRREAMRRNLLVAGTLAVLEKSAQRGWINLVASLQQLEQTNFRLSPTLRDELLKRNR